MMRGARTDAPRASRHDAFGFRKCDFARSTMTAQTLPIAGCAPRRRVGGGDAAVVQCIPRQIEPAQRRVLVEVAQDIGELQRAAKMMGEREAVIVLHAEDTHRQPPDRAGDAVAIKVERGTVGRADVGDDIHFHAVDDGEEVLRA